ncbi:MAG: MFS transporter, partial [Paracoccaceae bacterium]
FMALYGFGHGGFFSVVSPTVAEYFGMQSHGALFGIILFFGTIGGAIGPILAGMVFDYSGSYDSAFITLAILMALGLILVLTLPKAQAAAA